jgi:hypothetical protein
MVLGLILYEAVDLLYNIGSLTINGTISVYNWYYTVPNGDIPKEKEIEMLRMRLENLEKKLLANGTGENHEETENGEQKNGNN